MKINYRTWWISCDVFTCTVVTDDSLYILDTAPILRKWKGKFLEDIVKYYKIKPSGIIELKEPVMINHLG
jgi:hypothetical protein